MKKDYKFISTDNLENITSEEIKSRHLKIENDDYKRLLKSVNYKIVAETKDFTKGAVALGASYAASGYSIYQAILECDSLLAFTGTSILLITTFATALRMITMSDSDTKEKIAELKKLKEQYKKEHQARISEIERVHDVLDRKQEEIARVWNAEIAKKERVLLDTIRRSEECENKRLIKK